ncbi:MAG: hypothetical protein V8R14_02580 [Clostridia bacterium]
MNDFQIPLRKGYEITEAAKNMQSGMGKCFRFVMSHITGKIEILGALNENNMIFKYHQTKDEENQGRISFSRSMKINAGYKSMLGLTILIDDIG